MPSPPDEESGPRVTTPQGRSNAENATSTQVLDLTVPRIPDGRGSVHATLRGRPRHPARVLDIIDGPPAEIIDLDDRRPAVLRSWAAACRHLTDRGLPPLPPAHVHRALTRRGWWPR